MGKLAVFFLLFAVFLSGCAGRDVLPETIVIPAETTLTPAEETVAKTTAVPAADWKNGTVVHDLDGDGNGETLFFQDGFLLRILARNGKEEQVIFEDSASFLCDDGKTVVRFSEGSGGHTFFYYQLINGELELVECLVYHYADGHYFRSLDHSIANGSLVELTEEEYRQAMAAFPCTDAENSFLGHLF